MNREELRNILDKVAPLDQAAIAEAQRRQASLAKPPGSLGRLEDISIQLAGITGKVKNTVERSAIIVCSSDNGVCEEGIASAPQSVTQAQTINFTRRLTGVGALSKHFGVDLLVTDLGILDEIPAGLYTEDPAEALSASKIWNRKIRRSTSNLFKGPAMTEEEALAAIETGIQAAHAVKAAGYQIFGIGEMGIGNTTTSSCLLAALTGTKPADTVGRGGGINDEGFKKKCLVVETAVARAVASIADKRCDGDSNALDPIALLAEVGGFDIAAMAGAYIGAGLNRMPVVIDGYISVVAALVAEKIFQYYRGGVESGADGQSAVSLTDFMIASHKSYEKGYMIAMEELGLEPILLLGMRLGEGSGCPIAFKVVEAAAAVMDDMATFEEAAINDDYLDEIRRDKTSQQ